MAGRCSWVIRSSPLRPITLSLLTPFSPSPLPPISRYLQFPPAPLPHPLGAVHHHLLARLQPLCHCGVATLAGPGRDRTKGNGAVSIDHIDKGPLGAALDGG